MNKENTAQQDQDRKSTKPSNLRVIPSILLFGVVTFLLGMHFGSTSGDSLTSKATDMLNPSVKVERTSPETVDFESFWKVWDLVHEDYLDKGEINDSELVRGAIKGMVAAIGDPYTAYLPPEKNEAFENNLAGTYEGIGAELGMEEEQLIIVSPLEGSPAEAAGVRPKDKILKIEEESTVGVSIAEAVSKIRGPAGEPITLTLAREEKEEPFPVTIVRDEITLKSVKWEEKEGGIGYIRLSRFGTHTRQDWENAVTEMTRTLRPLNGVVLDMRSNPGGFLKVSVDIAGDFLPSGTTVVQQESKAGSRATLETEGEGRFIDVPVVILVNEGSASASEILAAAIEENREGVQLVGKKTFGKGTVQEKRDLEDGSGVQITVARWLTSKGNSIHETGLEVDVPVEFTEEAAEEDRDPQLERALEILNNN